MSKNITVSTDGIFVCLGQSQNTLPSVFKILKLFCGGLLGVVFCLFLSIQTAQAAENGSCIAGSDILFVIDDSGSVDSTEYSQMQNSIVDVGNQLLSANNNHQIGTMHFGGPPTDYTPGGQHVFFERDFSSVAVTAPVRQFATGGVYDATWSEDYLAGALLHAGRGLDRISSTSDPYIVSPIKELARRSGIPLHILIFTDMDRNLPNCCSALVDRADSGYQPDDGSEFTLYNLYKSQEVTFSIVGFNLLDDAKAAAAAISSFGGDYSGLVDANPNDPESGSGGKRLIIADPTSFSLTPAQVALATSNANCGTPSSDFGDAPASYGVAGHIVPASPILYLGAVSPDKDTNDLSSTNADGDDTSGTDDEDGVTIPVVAWVTGTTETVSVDIQGSGFLNSWIDWNLDGDFTDAGEQISNEMAVSTGVVSLSIAVPVSAASGDLPARFRLCSTAGDCNTAIGKATDGEVEDYFISVASCTDLSGDVSEIAAGIPF
ncbi:MAG: GEVED domain-containing protein, partial [Methylococcales bacterium]